MLYTRKELSSKGFIDSRNAMQRYLHKFINHRKEINKLKWHEMDFFYEHLQILRNTKNEKIFDIYSIPEAKDYILYKLILIYINNNNLDFNKKAFDYDCEINKIEKNRHKKIFFQLLGNWTKELEKGKGQYLMVIKTLYKRKLKELTELKEQKKIDNKTFVSRHIYMRATFYHVYYLVRKYFDGMKFKAESCTLCGIDIYADIYTYAHILTRHYYPSMNDGIGGSLNENISILDIWNLPSSILELVKLYAKVKTITTKTEYLLFIIENKKYILWMQYEKIALLENKEGMEIHSFYLCDQNRDLEKFNGKTTIKINESLSIVI